MRPHIFRKSILHYRAVFVEFVVANMGNGVSKQYQTSSWLRPAPTATTIYI